MPFNFRQIEVFRAVMTTGSISGASRLLFVSPPAVSKTLSDAESAVGYLLFERIKGRLYATPEAKRLLPEVEGVYLAMQRVNQVATDLEQDRHGLLRLIAHTSIGQTFIPETIGRFSAAYPQVKITFECQPHVSLQRRLLEQKTDLGVAIFPVEHPNLASTPLCEGPLVCVVPKGHDLDRAGPVILRQLRSYPLICYVTASPLGALIRNTFQAAGETMNAGVEVDVPQSAAMLVGLGMGIALMDPFSAHGCEAAGMVARPLAGGPVFQAHTVHRRFEPLSQMARDYVNVLGEGARKLWGTSG